MRLGIALGRLNPRRHEQMVWLADRLGFESVCLPEHRPPRRQGSSLGYPNALRRGYSALGCACCVARVWHALQLGSPELWRSETLDAPV